MAEIIRVYRQSLPATKFVGRCYTDADRKDGLFSNKWSEWFAQGLFEPLKINGEEPFEDANAFYGLCRCKEGEPFQYWIGVFLPVDFDVPDGYQSLDFDAVDIAVCWIYGKEPDVYELCALDRLKSEGYEWTADKNGVKWCVERYVCPRFTEPDDKGNIILDLCFFTGKKNKKINELKPFTDELEIVSLPDCRIIGKEIRNGGKLGNTAPALWDAIYTSDDHIILESLPLIFSKDLYGWTLEYEPSTNTFVYIVCALTPAGTPVPDGFTYRDIPATLCAVGLYGESVNQTVKKAKLLGYNVNWNSPGCGWNAELYYHAEECNPPKKVKAPWHWLVPVVKSE